VSYPKDVAKEDGTCFESSDFDDLAESAALIEFGTNGIDQCRVSVSDIADNCNSFESRDIFTQFSKFAIMGDAETSKDTDWKSLIENSVSSSTWEAGTGNSGVCKGMLNGFRYEVMHSKMGAENNLQNYIVGIRKVPTYTDFSVSDSTQDQDVYLTVTFSDIYILPEKLLNPSDPFPPRIGADLWTETSLGED